MRVATNPVNKVSADTKQQSENKPKAKKTGKRSECYRCGGKGHFGRDPTCPARGKKRHKCQKSDYFASMCTTKSSENPKQTNQAVQEENQDFAFAANSKP